MTLALAIAAFVLYVRLPALLPRGRPRTTAAPPRRNSCAARRRSAASWSCERITLLACCSYALRPSHSVRDPLHPSGTRCVFARRATVFHSFFSAMFALSSRLSLPHASSLLCSGSNRCHRMPVISQHNASRRGLPGPRVTPAIPPLLPQTDSAERFRSIKQKKTQNARSDGRE